MLRRVPLLAFLLVLLLPAVALAAGDVPAPNNELTLPSVQFYSLLVGFIAPLGGYILNHYAPWTSERIKGTVQGALAAGAGALTQLILTGDLTLDTATLEVVGTAVLGSIAGHISFKAADINTKLGGGSNA